MKQWLYFALPAAVALSTPAVLSSCAAGDTITSTGGASGTTSNSGGTGGAITTTSVGGSGGSGGAVITGGAGGSAGSGGTVVTGGGGAGGATTTTTTTTTTTINDFLAPCQTDADCQSNVCIQMVDGTMACTITCEAAAPCPSTDYRCSPLGSAQDETAYCLPRYDDLCKPCQSDDDCRLKHNGAPVFDRAVCEKLSSGVGANQTLEGSFCTTECSDTALPCPDGYSCKGIAGSVVKHCIKDDQKCDCLSWWPDPSTTCSNTTVAGTCSGSRQCSNGALTSCSAKVPAAEVCNGVDDNCSGATDEGGDALCPSGGLTCVTSTCAGAAGCTTTVNPGFCVIGGSLCVVAGTKNPANQCEACDPTKLTTGWSIRTSEACDDGEPCTTGETCSAAGVCGGGGATNCSALGSPPCSTGVCQAGVGCVQVNNDGATCDDGLFCTLGEKCAGGICGAGVGAGTPRDCSALNVLPCKTGVCSEQADQCVTQINQGTTCDDGNPCSTASSCNAAGTCAATSFKDCSGQNDACNVGICNSTNGACQKQPANIGASCDDANACTGNGTCATQGGVGVCTAGTPTPDNFEVNNAVADARTITTIDDCGNTTGSLNATVNPGTDTDWYKFTLNNSSSLCDYGTMVRMTPPSGRDYDLMVCVKMSGSFSASCANGSSVAAPSGLSGYSCCQSTLGAGVQDYVKVNWSCDGTFCSDNTGTVYVRVLPHGGTQTAECTNGYTLTWGDD